ncbi:NAD(P)-dependent oxidoreductase [Pseudoruegeria sp. SK021]|uniref:NAD(P)-dependent oxidoreductase n=1 Tax=Pseudoruegeria sp. SK021 TaxID=1933035 RepID=UPI000A2281EA|nr:NAD(P)-dependent oxidoreductase [Pseudoruegeria sp. SK021]OSP55990.1 3-hydroxyisobutyrate dehydrogenase [Pseudoruegeria sp. SK021]
MTSTQHKPVIGFIGVGLMGHGMAANILKSGYPLWVVGHRNRAPVDDLLGKGAQEADSPRALASACAIIHLCLSNSQQVDAVMRGPDGILASGKRGLIVVDSTTSDPGSTRGLATELSAAGMTLVDAPLGRTPVEAEAGTLDAMVGAAPEMFDRLRPIIDCWAGNVTHTGPVGSAHTMKLIMNFISLGYASLFSEALTLGVKSGLSPQIVRNVIGSSRMSNGFFETFMRYAVDRDPDAHKFSIQNASKDVRYAANMASDGDVVNLMGAAMKQYFTHAEATGHGAAYLPTMSDHIARLSGVDLAEAVKKGARADDE